jgi:hypothetical protein
VPGAGARGSRQIGSLGRQPRTTRRGSGFFPAAAWISALRVSASTASGSRRSSSGSGGRPGRCRPDAGSPAWAPHRAPITARSAAAMSQSRPSAYLRRAIEASRSRTATGTASPRPPRLGLPGTARLAGPARPGGQSGAGIRRRQSGRGARLLRLSSAGLRHGRAGRSRRPTRSGATTSPRGGRERG